VTEVHRLRVEVVAGMVVVMDEMQLTRRTLSRRGVSVWCAGAEKALSGDAGRMTAVRNDTHGVGSEGNSRQ
jgi:hypothetical protein